MNNIRRVSLMESKCTGCGACMNICPKKAIKLKERNGYFLFPEIKQDLCNDCGLCKSICPALKPLESRKKNYPVAYGCYVANQEDRKVSTSGGAFSALAKYVLNRGGYVCGAAFSKGTSLNHIIISNISDLTKFHGSKYLQSNIGFAYNDVKKLLNNDNYVLFIGTGCQVAGLKAVLGKDYDNLLTVDLFCHGTPPQKLFQQYIDEITGGKSDTVKNIRFRDKSPEGWEKFHFSFEYQNGRYDILGTKDSYFKAFRDCLTLRRSCTNCKFAEIPRQGDFTIGDFLSLAKKELNVTDDKGVSTLIVNNEKAEKFLNNIKKDFALLKKVELKKISSTNLLEYHSFPHPNAERFRDALYSGKYTSVKGLMDEYLKKNDNIAIINFHNSHNNYGSVLTGYALKERIKQKIGFSPMHIIGYVKGGDPDISDLIDFDHEYIPSTEPCWSDWHYRQLNKYYQTFITGPDGVWRNMGFTPNFYVYLLDFANISKNLCSYAPSFGLNRIVNTKLGDPTEREPSYFDLTRRKQLLKRFNHISVREESGVALCKEFFDVDAEHVLDAVFLLKEEDYQKLIDTSELEIPDNYFCQYIINQSCVDPEIVTYTDKNCPVVKLYEGADHITFVRNKDLSNWKYKGPKMVDWLKLMQGCKYVITDSFHGLCFAIIFKKPFVLTNVTFAGQERHKSLLKMLGITDNRIASTLDELKKILATPIDWDAVYRNLEIWYQKSDTFLDKILADNKPDKTRNLLHSLEIQQGLMRNGIRSVSVSRNEGSFDWKLRILGLSIIYKKTKGSGKKIYFLGIPVYRKKTMDPNHTRIYFLFIPFDLKREGLKFSLFVLQIKLLTFRLRR